MKSNIFGSVVAGAVAGLVFNGQAMAEGAAKKSADKAKGSAYCSPACNGKSECKGHGNEACKGKNSCHGHGWITAKDEADCTSKGGVWKAGK